MGIELDSCCPAGSLPLCHQVYVACPQLRKSLISELYAFFVRDDSDIVGTPSPQLQFEEKMSELSPTLYEQFAEAERLEEIIKKNLETLRYGE